VTVGDVSQSGGSLKNRQPVFATRSRLMPWALPMADYIKLQSSDMILFASTFKLAKVNSARIAACPAQ